MLFSKIRFAHVVIIFMMNHITNAFETQILLIELKKYENVFLIKSANKLSLHENHDHAIKITAESLYESLYSLLNTELIILRQYLNDVLAKEWIKHFINLTDAFILFILKKNDSFHLCMNDQQWNSSVRDADYESTV